jgi:EAL domain-containing protein (putative c-di-GMP-specific phosphodiesterase class I)
VDVLKIDRHYVDSSSSPARVLLELMVKAAHAFGVRVVAEGVEHPEQLELVRRLGCEHAQGYHLGMPAPADKLRADAADGLLAG